jgi:hypothetical protein
MVGKPAGPTAAPGGSVEVAACVGAAGVVEVVLVDESVEDADEEDEESPDEDEDDAPSEEPEPEPEPELESDPVLVVLVLVVLLVEEVCGSASLTARKSTPAACAALSSWKTSDGTESSAGTAWPSRAIVA